SHRQNDVIRLAAASCKDRQMPRSRCLQAREWKPTPPTGGPPPNHADVRTPRASSDHRSRRPRRAARRGAHFRRWGLWGVEKRRRAIPEKQNLSVGIIPPCTILRGTPPLAGPPAVVPTLPEW